jgi:hypothetical protein
MTEPLFGSVSGSPIWTGIPSGGFGLPQIPAQFGSVPIGAGVQGFGSPQFQTGGLPMEIAPAGYGLAPQGYGFSGLMPQPPGIGFAPVGPALGIGAPVTPNQFAAPSGFPAYAGQDLAVGITVPALVATVAIRRRQPLGPTNDQEIEDFIYDALELLPGTNEVEVRCEGGRVTLTGSVQHKRLKRDVGEIAWTIPGTNDVQNNVTIATRRRARAATRETEPQATGAGRKQG